MIRTTFDNVRKQIVISARGTVSAASEPDTAAPTSQGKITARAVIMSALSRHSLQPDALRQVLTGYGIKPDTQRRAIDRGMGTFWSTNADGSIGLTAAAAAALAA